MLKNKNLWNELWRRVKRLFGGQKSKTEENQYRRHHYVPIWYQKRFVLNPASEHELYYLSLKPPQFIDSKGKVHTGNPVRRLGFKYCFAEEDLYTTNFNGVESKKLEQLFFGQIDKRGQAAVEWCNRFSHPWDGSDRINDLLLYMSTQKLRTPKGLAWLRAQASKLGVSDKNSVLALMTSLRQLYGSIWMECVWLIVDASKSNTKFIISDHPVTIYNRRCDPRSGWCRRHNDPDIRFHASHTLFPLSLDKMLILTNLSWVRNPYQNELGVRPNPNFFRGAIMKITDIQTLRFLSEEEVRQINFIIKSRAYKYIAAAKEEWLYPEKYVSKSGWYRYGHGYLLMPDPRGVEYGGQIIIGHWDGTASAFDEYGRRPWQKGFKGFDKSGVEDDWYTFHRFQGEFARLFGPYRRGRAFSVMKIDNERDSDEFYQYHLNLERQKKNH